jgi:hypothetical protein
MRFACKMSGLRPTVAQLQQVVSCRKQRGKADNFRQFGINGALSKYSFSMEVAVVTKCLRSLLPVTACASCGPEAAIPIVDPLDPHRRAFRANRAACVAVHH